LVRHRIVASLAVFLFLPSFALADVVTSIADGTVYNAPAVNYYGTGPQTLAPGITWTATGSSGSFGNSGGYGLGLNGLWFGDPPLEGTNDVDGSMTFSFASPVSAVGGFLNYAPDSEGAAFEIQAFDSLGNLIESYDPVISTPNEFNAGAFYGFQENSADISSFVVSGSFGALRDLTLPAAAASPVPEPGSLIFLSTGIAGLIARRFRRS
jgi:hypothetical protein